MVLKYWLPLLLTFTFEGSTSITSNQYAFTQGQLVPDVVPRNPATPLEINYGPIDICAGKEMNIDDVQNPPTSLKWACPPPPPAQFVWSGGRYIRQPEQQNLFTLMMFDADPPCRSNRVFKGFLHWVVGNIKGTNIASGDTVASFFSPGPAAGTKLHRYVTLVYQQPNSQRINFTAYTHPQGFDRLFFDVGNFTAKYKLPAIPWAGNYFQAENATKSAFADPCDPNNP